MAEEGWSANEVGAFLAGLAVGAVFGAGAALLYAPQSGERTRGKLRRAAEELSEAAEERARYAAEDARRLADEAREAAERSGRRVGERVKKGVEEGRRRFES